MILVVIGDNFGDFYGFVNGLEYVIFEIFCIFYFVVNFYKIIENIDCFFLIVRDISVGYVVGQFDERFDIVE